MLQTTYISGYTVKYEDGEANIFDAINYLSSDLSQEEAAVFFDQAKAKGSAAFETDTEGQYTLSYNADNTYNLLKRDFD